MKRAPEIREADEARAREAIASWVGAAASRRSAREIAERLPARRSRGGFILVLLAAVVVAATLFERPARVDAPAGPSAERPTPVRELTVVLSSGTRLSIVLSSERNP